MGNKNDKALPRKSMVFETGMLSHQGMVRSSQEDSLISLELVLWEDSGANYCGLSAVADGVGGLEGGEIASSLALQVLAESLSRGLLLPKAKGTINKNKWEFVSGALAKGVKQANKEIYSQNLAKDSDMGTTLAVALIVNTTAYIANVGDSRVYLLNGDILTQVTADHSLVASLVAAGQISREEIYTHPRRNIITRHLGGQQDVEVDLFTEELKSGMCLIVCSDGLWEMVRDDEIKDIVRMVDKPQTACERLVEVANRNGGVDNISVVIVKVTTQER